MQFNSYLFVGSFAFGTKDKSYVPLNGLIGDLQQQLPIDIDAYCQALKTNEGHNGLVGEAYALQWLDEDYTGIYLGVAFKYESYAQAPEEHRCKVKTDFLVRVLRKWKAEETEYKQDPEAYKAAIERGEKVFEIEE